MSMNTIVYNINNVVQDTVSALLSACDITKKYQCVDLTLYGPFTVQVVYPVVTGDPPWQNHLPGHSISELFTLQAAKFVVISIWQNASVLQLPLEIRM